MIPINKPFLGKEELAAVAGVLKSGIITDKSGAGPMVMRFERNYSEFVGSKHAIAVSSGTAALHTALASVVGPGCDVIVPSFTFHATAEAVVLANCKPVFADIDPATYCITSETIKAVLTPRTKAIIPVHLYGLCADMNPIMEMAHERGLFVIDDAAQAHGSEYAGKRMGSIGDATCFSFYAGKNMTTGEGGIVTTNSDVIADRARAIRTHGEERPYWVTRPGNNYHMTEIAAAIGIAQLKKLPSFLASRRRNAKVLSDKLGFLDELSLPQEPSGRRHAWYLYTLRLKNSDAKRRNDLLVDLRAKGVGAAVYYDKPVHILPYYQEIAPTKRLIETERASQQVFSLPVHPFLKPQDLKLVASATLDCFS